MKKFFFIFFILFSTKLFAQTPALQNQEDSILKIALKAKTIEAKCNAYFDIARIYTGQNKDKETEYINKAIFEAEQIRDRKLIATMYRKTAEQWLSLPGLERQEKALAAIEKGLIFAKEAQYNLEIAALLQKKAATFRNMGKLPDAIKVHAESINYADLSNNDSLKISVQISYANSLLAKDENLEAFRKYMQALNLAESINENKLKVTLYGCIASFYAKITQTEKAKDYYVKAIEQAKAVNDSNNVVINYGNIITLYAKNKEFSIAKEYLKLLQKKVGANENYKQYALSSELQIVYYEDQKNLPDFFKKNPELLEGYKKYRMLSEYNRVKGIILTFDGKMDSAFYYLNLAKKELKPNDINAIMTWNSSYSIYLDKNKKYAEAANYLSLNIPLVKQIQSLTAEREIYNELDSFYIKAGDKQKEVANKLLLFTIKDSLDKQQKANDLLSVEIDLENKRTERENVAKAEKVRTRNNLQYMGITAFIFALFIALAAMGKFKVKPWFIKALGFISFILLFEFIILLIDHQLHVLTHGEPLPILLVKIIIIAFLLPFHHWLEHKVIHYLMRHKDDNMNNHFDKNLQTNAA
jgi:hypothetical protein